MVRGFAGFGAAMVMTPIFSALYGPAVGVALCLMLEIAVALPVVPGVVRPGRLAPYRSAAGRGGRGRAVRQSCPDLGGARTDALGDLGDRAGRRRAAGQRLAFRRPAARRRRPWRRAQQRLPQRPGRHGRPADRLLLPGRSTKARRTCGPTSRPISCSSISWPSRPLPRAAWSTGTPSCWRCSWRRPSCWAACWAPGCFPLASESFYRRLALALLVGVAIGVLDPVSGNA